jgi:hypothetical protein
MRQALHSFFCSPYLPLSERATVVHFEVPFGYSTEKPGISQKVFLARATNALIWNRIANPGTAHCTISFGKPTIFPATQPTVKTGTASFMPEN